MDFGLSPYHSRRRCQFAGLLDPLLHLSISHFIDALQQIHPNLLNNLVSVNSYLMLGPVVSRSVQTDLIQIWKELFLTPVVVFLESFQKQIEPHLLRYHHSVVTRDLLVDSFSEVNQVLFFLLHKILQRLHEFDALNLGEGIGLRYWGIENYIPEVDSQDIIFDKCDVSCRSVLGIHCWNDLFGAHNIEP